MIGAKSFFIDSKSASVELFSLVVVALSLQRKCQIVKVCGHERVIRTESFFVDSKSVSKKRFSIVVVDLSIEQRRQIIQALCNKWMFWAESFFANSECMSIEQFSIVVSTQSLKYMCVGVEIERVFILDGGGFFVVTLGFRVIGLLFAGLALQVILFGRVL